MNPYSSYVLKKGFTLVELLVSVSIIALIATVVLVRFTDFDSTTILRSLAFEVATAIREAQVISLGTQVGSGVSFNIPSGITFTPRSKEYTLTVVLSFKIP